MIVPALLTDKKENLIEMIDLCSKFTDYVQIDIMDGKFVPSKSISILDLKGWKSRIRCEAHLMVSDPLSWLKPFKKLGAERIIYHFEISKDHLEIISKIRQAGLSAGLAVNPPTTLEEFDSLVASVDTVLFMSVNPGFYGAKFMPEVLEKIKAFKNKYPRKQVGIDGGIKPDKAVLARKAGVDCICVGSAILKSSNPKRAYENILKVANE